MVDYLSLDIDGYYDVVLKKIPFKNYTFKVITIEHDFYRYGEVFRQQERQILSSLGYYLLCPDVSHPACGSFEDWWIHPSAFSPSTLQILKSLDLKTKDYKQLVQTVKTASLN